MLMLDAQNRHGRAEKFSGIRATLTGKEVPYKFEIYMQNKEMFTQEKVLSC